MIGKVLNNRYKIIDTIGRGGMAIVYKAIDLKLNREVAVKVLRDEYTENEQFIRKFDRESQAAAGLTHPNIVSVYDVGVQDNIYYIIMEYVDGITLKQYLNQKGHLDSVEATQFVLEVSSALKCAHDHKIIHRDIKPHNILLTQDLTPKVADFGIARAATSSTVTVTNQTMGSVHYISPEQARGGFVDERSDLYSLGIMYYELLTGQLPYDAESSVSIAIKHIQEPIVPPKDLNPEIPNSVNDVILKLTQKKPEDRYQNTQELIDDLDLLLDDFDSNLPNTNTIQTAPIDGFGTELFTIEESTNPNKVITDTTTTEETEKKDLKMWIILGAIFIILLIGSGILLANTTFTKQVVVPDVSNIPLTDATRALEEVGLVAEVERETYNATVPSGNVISQNPASGSNVREGSTIKLTISQGVQTESIPNVVGLTEEEANSKLTDAGFTVEIQREFNDRYNSGIVYQSDPGAGTKLVTGETVVIYVSKGEDTVVVPGIIGLAQNDAENRLNSNGLYPGTVSYENSTTYPVGVVISQTPSEGSTVERGTYVSYVVSSGPPSSSNTDNPNNSNTDDEDSTNTEENNGNTNDNNNSSNNTSTDRSTTNNRNEFN